MAQWNERESTTNGGTHPEANGSAALLEDPQAQLTELIENARSEMERYVSTAADFIRARPVACVVGAVAVGFLVGKLASRNK